MHKIFDWFVGAPVLLAIVCSTVMISLAFLFFYAVLALPLAVSLLLSSGINLITSWSVWLILTND